MEGDWTQVIVMLAAIFGVFVWLRNDIKQQRIDTRNDIKQLRTDMQEDMKQLRSDMQRLERKVDNLDSRLRAVESEQSRITGLLEGLGLAGVLPTQEA